MDDAARLGHALLGQQVRPQQQQQQQQVLLMGHSLGTGTTLRLALQQTRRRVHVVLVSPILGRQHIQQHDPRNDNNNKMMRMGPVARAATPLVRYTLRRLVGQPGFWRRGLQKAFVRKLTDTEVLRYQWPSIVQGWEDGLWRWILQSQQPRDLSAWLSKVVAAPHVQSVSVILGKDDPLIDPESTRMFLATYHPTVRVVEMDGVGHDPMEEDIPGFVRAVQQLVVVSSDEIE